MPVIARFSLAGGNPKAPDTARSPRGMALEFQLPGGGLQHMTMLNTPVFGAAHPKTFLDLMIAKTPDPATGKPDPEKMKAFKASHPDNRAQAEFLAKNNPPASYTTSSYFGIHTFKFIDRDDKTTLVRWRFAPQDGERRLSDAELKSAAPDFLEPALMERVKQGPVRWDMVVTIGAPGDPETDPTLAWPTDRQEVKVGTLTLASASPRPTTRCSGSARQSTPSRSPSERAINSNSTQASNRISKAPLAAAGRRACSPARDWITELLYDHFTG